jgi:hypothetical protein
MAIAKQNLMPLPRFTNWAYDIHEVSPGLEQVSLYRDAILRFVAPVDASYEKVLADLRKIASEMEFDIQRKLSQRLYGFDVVARENDIFADVANADIRRFLASHAVSLKKLGVLECGVRSVDVPNFLDVVDGNGKQVLAIVSYLESIQHGVTGCGEKWRMRDMQTPTESSQRENIALVRGFFENKSLDEERQSIYSFVIDSRDIFSAKPESGHGVSIITSM